MLTSPDNQHIKRVRSYLQREASRRESDIYILEHEKAILQALERGIAVSYLVLSESYEGPLSGAEATTYRVSDRVFSDLSHLERSPGALAVLSRWEPTLDVLCEGGAPLLVLDGIQDPSNVGAIARNAWAFGASGMILLPGTANWYHPKVCRTAVGAHLFLPVMHTDFDVFSDIEAAGCHIASLEPEGDVLTPRADRLALVLGSEGSGISEESAARVSQRWRIPMVDSCESLNVAVSSGIVLQQLYAKT